MVRLKLNSGELMNSNNELSTHTESFTPPSLFKKPVNGFSKPLRILKPKDFQHVFSKADKFGNRNWTFIVRPNQQPYPRLGLAIAKKQLQRAVWRNRVKRLAREAFRLHKKELSGYDIVVLGRKGMQEIDNKTLHKSFLHLVRKIRNSDLKDRK
mgnify:CR=1 FL=1